MASYPILESPRRRRFLAAGALFGIAGAARAAPSPLQDEQVRHLLLRTGFEPTDAEIADLAGQSAAAAVQALLRAAKAARPRHPFDESLDGPGSQQVGGLSPEDRKAARREQVREGMDIKRWWFREMIESPTPLAERMTLFWHGHFATSQQKVVRAGAMWRQHVLLRSQALGSFRDLLHGIGRDPAMLVYLDGARSRRGAPNENFAREVMELFVLGEATRGGGYTEQDIREAARAFTGWSVDRETFEFRLRPAFHDAGEKTVLGRTGAFDGDGILDILLDQPAAGRFISAKLWREFVSPEPDAREVERLGARFRAGGYDIASLIGDLLMTDAFWDPANRAALVKSPVELVVGAVRQLGVSPPDTRPLVLKCAQLGQNLLVPPNVKGWPGYNDWIDATTLIERKRLGEQLAMAMQADGGRAAFLRRISSDPAYQLK